MKTETKYNKALAWINKGMKTKEACEKAGMGYSTFQYWNRKNQTGKQTTNKKHAVTTISYAENEQRILAFYGTAEEITRAVRGMQ